MKSDVLAIVFKSSLSSDQKVELAEEINALSDCQSKDSSPLRTVQQPPFVGKYCIIRTYSAGVHCGVVADHSGTEVILNNARRIHYWNGAFTLNAIAENGAGDGSRLSVPVPEILLTESIEVLPCSPLAIEWLSNREAHSND
ncbi:MAG: DUF6948 domain-containing protein [Microcoleus sp.]